MKPESYIQKAYRCILQNDFEEALRWFEQAIIANPGDAEVHYRCSITYGRSNKLEMAITHAEEAVEVTGQTGICASLTAYQGGGAGAACQKNGRESQGCNQV